MVTDLGVKDRQSITADWNGLEGSIAGVRVREVKNVIKPNGDVLCEIFRREWFSDECVVDQVFQVTLDAGSVSAWHMHRSTTDRLFVSRGLIRIVLYDAREDSPTRGQVSEFRFGAMRPGLVCVPPGVWHGVQNMASEPAILLNLVDAAYKYSDPDHWRLPEDTDEIPYRFTR
jgi:dTDP-4-dehydrorhamnose 3,5-epimerase